VAKESGGIGTNLYIPERDATVSALLLAELMAWHGKIAWRVAGRAYRRVGEYHYGRVDLDLNQAKKKKPSLTFRMPKLTRILDLPVVRRKNMDGIKLYLGDVGW